MAFYYRQRPTPALLDRLERLWGGIRRFFYDDEYGAWYPSVGPDGAAADDTKGGDWKAAYHVVQACLHAGKYLEC